MANWPNIQKQYKNAPSDEVIIRHGTINYVQDRESFAASMANARWSNEANYTAGSEIQGSDGKWYVAVVNTGSATSNSVDPVTRTDDTVWSESNNISDSELYAHTSYTWGTAPDGSNMAPSGVLFDFGSGKDRITVYNATNLPVAMGAVPNESFKAFKKPVLTTPNEISSLNFAFEGLVFSTGVGDWRIVSTSGIQITGTSFYAMPLNGVHVSDFNPVAINKSIGESLYSDDAFSDAQSIAKQCSSTVLIPSGWFRLSADLEIKASTKGLGREESVLIFDDGKAPTNIISANEWNDVKEISGFKIISDKSAYWNQNDAGQSWDASVTDFEKKLEYGQRIAKGNKTTTPNNITGFGDYTQWMQQDGQFPDLSGLPSAARKAGEPTFRMHLRCKIESMGFEGFEKGCVLVGTYQTTMDTCFFKNCNRGLYTTNAAYIGGAGAARITSLAIKGCDFEDCDIAHDGQEFLQSTFTDNVMQACIVGQRLAYAAGSTSSDNYFEIGHSGFYVDTNDDSYGTTFARNFCNTSYSRYNVALLSGISYRCKEPQSGNNKIKMADAVSRCQFDDFYDMTESNGGFFYRNGNQWKPSEPKDYYIKTLGDGTTFTITPVSLQFNMLLDLSPLVTGLRMWANTTSIQNRTKNISFDMLDQLDAVRYYDASGVSNPREDIDVVYFNKIDGTELELNAAGVEHIIKITFV
ncbi:hypothetical protein KUA24_37 [Vibrio phage HNL01]|nr:hypothetical protein KUA24_37 [Vibrio phage HNL01]